MSSDVLLIEPIDKNASIPPILKIAYDFISKCVPILSEKKLEECDIDVYDFFKYQSGLVVNSPRWIARTGLLSIAAYLEHNGYKVDYLPLNYLYAKNYQQANKNEEKWIVSILKNHISSDKVIGITATTPEFKGALKVLEICKKNNPNVLTVIGGYHVTFQDINTLENKFVDVVVRGEGEETMLEIVQTHKRGQKLSHIKGISYRINDNVKRNPERPPADLNSIPMPAYHLLPREAVKSIRISTMLSRGCPYNCLFCIEGKFWRHKLRYRPLDSVIEELEYVKDKFNLNFIHIADSSCDLHHKKIDELCDYIINNKIDIF